MKISILTLFPDMFQGPLTVSILKRAQEKGHIALDLVNIRDFGIGKHQLVDDTPYGGGIGMVMRIDVLHKAIMHTKQTFAAAQDKNSTFKQHTILMTARGKTFNQNKAKEYSNIDHLLIICGHYEGVDERIRNYIDEEISIGDFILTGGEIPAMLVTDAVTRLLPGVITTGATDHESFSYTTHEHTLLEYPQFTKPTEYDGEKVPDVLLSGNHKKIAEWRESQALEKTKNVRPDMIKE